MIVNVSLWTHRETRGAVLSLEIDQESSRIELVYVRVRGGVKGRLGCGFILLNSIFYILYHILSPMFYILHISTSII